VLVAHETELSKPEASMSVGDDQVVPSKVTARPAKSTATQNVPVAHETELRKPEGSTTFGADQVVPSKVTAWPA
jgi:hypothetical protein